MTVADEGISGTNTKHRVGFNEMIEDALAGKIDLIVTKSVSRFARNTVDSLVTIRKLKEKGVEVYFEKENIYTFDGKGELLLTIMSSLAQEESRSISENVTWGQRKRFADGKVNLPYKQFLGYRKGADGFPEVVPEEAVIVRRIYTRFMEGLTPGAIAKELTADTIPTPSGKQRWQTSTVESILQNEKYKGAALLQKCFTVDFLEDCRLMQTTLTDCTGIDAEIESLLEEIDVVTELTKRCIAENSQTAQNQEEYAARYNGFVERYEKAKAQLEQLRATKAAREAPAHPFCRRTGI